MPLPTADEEAERDKAHIIEVVSERDGISRRTIIDPLRAVWGTDEAGNVAVVMVAERTEVAEWIAAKWSDVLRAHHAVVVGAEDYWRERPDELWSRQKELKRAKEAKRRQEGYEWLIGEVKDGNTNGIRRPR